LHHGGAAHGVRSEDGKQRQREGYARYVLRLRGQGRKPGPRKGTGGRPYKRDMIDPVEQQRLAVLAALPLGDVD
jgi:alpha-beta hydrolase superfamily lysophospholipase